MSTLTTPREIRSPQNGAVPEMDSPAVSARARARIGVTDRVGNTPGRVSSALGSWWGWTAQPGSLAQTWKASAVDESRIPARSGALKGLWLVSNATDRLIWFALIAVAPTFLQGPLRFLAVRPTRRYGFYIIATVLVALYFLGRST